MIERPAGARRAVAVAAARNLTRRESFEPSPGDHRAIVGTKRHRRHHKAGTRFFRGIEKRRADRLVGRNAAGNDERRGIDAGRGTELFQRQLRLDDDDIGDGGLKGGGEIGDILIA